MPLNLAFNIEKATFADRFQLLELESECFDPDLAFSRRQLSYLLRSPRVEIYVMRTPVPPLISGVRGDGDRIIAEAIFLRRKTRRGEVGRLYSLAVKPTYRGQGYGKQLLVKSLESLRRQNIFIVYLEVEAENRTAIGLYQSLGFCPIKVLKGYYHPERDGLKMKLNLA